MSIKETTNWLQSFYKNFDVDVEHLSQLEPFWHVCRKCADGYCCGTNSYISLKSKSNPFLIEDWWLMLEYVRDNFSMQEKKQLARNIISNRKACIFLFNNRCRVHPNRPWGSRIHPYTINFAENAIRFPVGEIALSSCPSMASAFGLKMGETLVQRPQVIKRAEGDSLVLVKLRKHKPLWLIDVSKYILQFEQYAAIKQTSTTDLQQLFELAQKAGGDYGDLLKLYLEMIFKIRTNVRLIPPDKA
jgi:Fe-S-cluster containining protein